MYAFVYSSKPNKGVEDISERVSRSVYGSDGENPRSLQEARDPQFSRKDSKALNDNLQKKNLSIILCIM